MYRLKAFMDMTGTTRKALRIYELKGIISPARLENGYRVYSEADLNQMKQIVYLRSLGFSLEEVKKLLNRLGEGNILDFLSEKKRELEKQILEQKAIVSKLEYIIQELKEERRKSEITLGTAERKICLHFSEYQKEYVTEDQHKIFHAVLHCKNAEKHRQMLREAGMTHEEIAVMEAELESVAFTKEQYDRLVFKDENPEQYRMNIINMLRRAGKNEEEIEQVVAQMLNLPS